MTGTDQPTRHGPDAHAVVFNALNPFGAGQYGDLALSADRAAVLAVSALEKARLLGDVDNLRAQLRGDQPLGGCEWCEQPVTVGQEFAYQPGTGGLVEHTACATPGGAR